MTNETHSRVKDRRQDRRNYNKKKKKPSKLISKAAVVKTSSHNPDAAVRASSPNLQREKDNASRNETHTHTGYTQPLLHWSLVVGTVQALLSSTTCFDGHRHWK